MTIDFFTKILSICMYVEKKICACKTSKLVLLFNFFSNIKIRCEFSQSIDGVYSIVSNLSNEEF